MSEAAEYLLDLPSRQVFGTEVEFRNPITKRKKLGVVTDINAKGVRCRMRNGVCAYIPFNLIVRISKPSQP